LSVRRKSFPLSSEEGPREPSDPFTRDAEEKLTRRLKTRVKIARSRRGGKIVISFGSEEELMGLFDRLSGKN
jgi:hypothetical protein